MRRFSARVESVSKEKLHRARVSNPSSKRKLHRARVLRPCRIRRTPQARILRSCRIRQAKGELHRVRVLRRVESVKLRGNSTGCASVESVKLRRNCTDRAFSARVESIKLRGNSTRRERVRNERSRVSRVCRSRVESVKLRRNSTGRACRIRQAKEELHRAGAVAPSASRGCEGRGGPGRAGALSRG